MSCFVSWVKDVFDLSDDKLISIDGKSLRSSSDVSKGKAMLHMFGAWASESCISLAGIPAAEKSNEITAIPAIWELVDVEGAIITIDVISQTSSPTSLKH